MQKARLVFEELKQKFENGKNRPSVHWQPVGNSFSEEFCINYAGGKITVKAQGYLGAIYALQRIQTGLASGHLADLFASTAPHFKLRPLWLEDAVRTVSKEPAKAHLFCKRILELGYNAVMIDSGENLANLKTLCLNLKSYGLKIILKTNPAQNQKLDKGSPLNKNYQDFIADHLKTILSHHICFDYLFWESSWQLPEFTADPQADHYTLPEIVLAEVRLLEQSLNHSQNLIFYLPCADEMAAKQSAVWMPRLADDLGEGSILAFSAVAGDCFEDHLTAHPFWNQLRLRIEPSSAPLLPILNVGHVRQGEGLWPVLMTDLIHEYIPRCRKGNFAGILAIANQLPAEGSIHDCNLWTASQAMWNRDVSALLWVETWFSAFRTDWNYPLCSTLLNQIRALSKQMRRLHSLTASEKSKDQSASQECRLYAESILMQLNELQVKIEKEERKQLKKNEKSTLGDYFTYFASDVRKTVLHFTHCFNVSIPNSINENDLKESFWTEVNNRPGQSMGMRSSSKISFLESPNKGAPGSRMQMIYQENRMF